MLDKSPGQIRMQGVLKIDGKAKEKGHTARREEE
jgi:hypothetical protein